MVDYWKILWNIIASQKTKLNLPSIMNTWPYPQYLHSVMVHVVNVIKGMCTHRCWHQKSWRGSLRPILNPDSKKFQCFNECTGGQNPRSPPHACMTQAHDIVDLWHVCVHVCMPAQHQEYWTRYIRTLHLRYSSESVHDSCGGRYQAMSLY